MPNHQDLEQARAFFAAKMAFTTGVAELAGMLQRGEKINVIDVRAPRDYDAGHIPRAVNLPEHRWDTERGLSHDRPNIVYCYSQTCHLAAKAALDFARRGYPVIELEGGFSTWASSGKPVERDSQAVVQ